MLRFYPDEVVLTHATSTKAKGTERYYFLETTDGELFAGLSDIVDTVNKMQNTRLIIQNTSRFLPFR